MSASRFGSDPIEEAARAVGDYLRIALEQRFLGLQTMEILCAAESVWNNYEPGMGPPPFEETGVDVSAPAFQNLVQELHRVRSGRFAGEQFFVFSLDYEYEEEDLRFTCDLMWDGGSVIHPFEMRVSRQEMAPPERN